MLELPRRAVPMFPLPGVFLYPSAVLPLHVFEPRYRQMIEDVLDGPGRIVLGTLLQGPTTPAAATPPVLPIGGLGELVRHEKLPDGRFLIWLLGLARVRLQEVPSERLYRQVRCEPFGETMPLPSEAEVLKTQLRQATEARLGKPLPLPGDTPTVLLADLLIQTLQAPPDLLEGLYAEPSVAARAARALQLHTLLGPGPTTDA